LNAAFGDVTTSESGWGADAAGGAALAQAARSSAAPAAVKVPIVRIM
jgi:hypothetical protein